MWVGGKKGVLFIPPMHTTSPRRQHDALSSLGWGAVHRPVLWTGSILNLALSWWRGRMYQPSSLNARVYKASLRIMMSNDRI